jgi:hypothetical protein
MIIASPLQFVMNDVFVSYLSASCIKFSTWFEPWALPLHHSARRDLIQNLSTRQVSFSDELIVDLLRQ